MDSTARLKTPYSGMQSPRIEDRQMEYPFARLQPQEINRTTRWAFYMLVFSLPFEMPKLGMPLEVTTFTGSFFLLTTLLQPGACFRRPPRAFWWFFIYLYVYASVSLWYITGHPFEVVKLLLLLIQLILMCWAGCNVMRDAASARATLLTLIAGCTVLALFQLLGIASSAVETGSDAQRFTVLGQNPNNLARMFSMGLLALVALTYGRAKSELRPSFLAWPLFGLILLALVDTGSRGSLLALGVGLLTVMSGGKTLGQRFRNVLVAVVAIGFGFWASYASETTRVRFERSIDEGSMAKREVIFPAAWQLFLDSPLIGWGPVNNTWELGSRIGELDHPSRDTHNLGLELLTATGVLGAVPFFIGTCLCILLAWKARSGTQGVLPFAMIAAIVISNMGANLLHSKLHWFVLSYVLASGIRVRTRFRSVIRR
jgi:O-antigen ligase